MGGISDKGLKPIVRFPDGLNNVVALTAFPVDENGNVTAFADGANIDIDNSGRVLRARGHEIVFPGNAHSLHARDDELIGVVDADMCAFRDQGNGLSYLATLFSPCPRPIVYASDDDGNTYWSDGAQNGRISQSLAMAPFWIATPDPVSVAIAGTGSLSAGSYEVSVTAVDVDGRESGASAPVLIAVGAGQGISVTLPAAPSGAVKWRLYATTADGETFYRCVEVDASVTAYDIALPPQGPDLETAWLFPMPPCTALVYAIGRLFGLTEGNLLIWSEPYRLGLMHADNHLRLGQEASLLVAVGEGSEAQGLFVDDHRRTYWLAGGNPQNWQQVVRRPSGAVPGTVAKAPGTVFGLETEQEVAFWVERTGTLCLGLPGGSILPLRESEVALPVNAERGCAEFFGFGGLQQVVFSMIGGDRNILARAGDAAEATVRRNGVVI